MKKNVLLIFILAMTMGLMACGGDDDEKVPEEVKDPYNGHEYVDLGLSVKWASFNIGATKPEGYGDYYAWGETETKSTYEWSNYKYCVDSPSTLTKYCTDSEYGMVDKKTVLELSDDVAHVKWGGNWRIPTKYEMAELIENCTWTWTTLNGVEGCKVASKVNGNSIFLPAASGGMGTPRGSYWSSSICSGHDGYASYLFLDSRSWNWGYNMFRSEGMSVRAVCP